MYAHPLWTALLIQASDWPNVRMTSSLQHYWFREQIYMIWVHPLWTALLIQDADWPDVRTPSLNSPLFQDADWPNVRTPSLNSPLFQDADWPNVRTPSLNSPNVSGSRLTWCESTIFEQPYCFRQQIYLMWAHPLCTALLIQAADWHYVRTPTLNSPADSGSRLI